MRCYLSLVLLTVLVIFSCSSEEEEKQVEVLTRVDISLDSTRFQRVYDQINAGRQDSLIPYLSHPDPSFRVLATRGFANMMDVDYIPVVGKGMTDPIVEVRRITAYTLGQSRDESAIPWLMQVFENQDSIGIDPLTFRYALESVGKCGDSTFLPLLAGISTYKPEDTLLLEGQSLGILRLSAKGYRNPMATRLMVSYATDTKYPTSVRQIASEYLARISELSLEAFQDSLFQALEAEDDPNIRMFIGKAAGRTGSGAGPRLHQLLRQEEDSRVRIAMLQGCVGLDLSQRHRIWSSALNDPEELVAMTAADLILQYGSSGYSDTYTNWAFSNFRPTVYARLLGAGNKYISNSRFREMVQDLILRRIGTESDPYVKSDFIMSAGQRWTTASQLPELDREDSPPVIRTAILEAMMLATRLSDHIADEEKDFLIDRWKSGDIAAISLLSPFFVEKKSLFPEITADAELWSRLQDAIPLPEGIEGYIQMEKARTLLFGNSSDMAGPDQKLPVSARKMDWEVYEDLPPHQKAELVTSKGTIILELWKEKSPGTVVNFVRLAESGYYEGLPIHRVVPNFVLQGGCNRGDGYGSLDYTIRSEVDPAYFDQPGLIGMASAGLHTESQQWFITYRPSPHLDGLYTVFGQVIEGLDILENIRRGDIIQKISIID